MTTADWASTIYGYFFVAATIGTGLWYVFKHGVHTLFDQHLEEIKPQLSELSRNGGGSIKDAVEDIREAVHEISKDLARLEGKFEQHVSEPVRRSGSSRSKKSA